MRKSVDNLKIDWLIRLLLAYTIGLVGFMTILASTKFGFRHEISRFNLGPPTAWFQQHNIVTGVALLYLARKIYKGERLAFYITTSIVALQFFKYSLFEPEHLSLSVLYFLVFIVLYISKRHFYRHSTPHKFIERLKTTLIAMFASVVVVTLVGVLFKLNHPRTWDNSGLSATRIVKRVTLLELSPNKQDSLTARLFNQTLTTLGVAIYAWIGLGLFSPRISRSKHSSLDRDDVAKLLNAHGRNSEDSFKLWPEDKQYYFGENRQTVVAYKIYKSYAIALHEPVGTRSNIGAVYGEFRDFCRRNGLTSVWLMLNSGGRNNCLKYDYRCLKIGASAVVDKEQFKTETVKQKWWRWNRNKNIKLGLVYAKLSPPHDQVTIARLEYISDQWLKKNQHKERTFALGYFDEQFIKQCQLHVLLADGQIVAFANQLPTYNHNPQVTIDLMRSLPEYAGSMSFLLSETILALSEDLAVKSFDLGFVPLAQTESELPKKIVLQLTTSLLNSFFSARGLKQFKNKFGPIWHDNYLAWDGDWVELGSIAGAIDKVLELSK